MMGQVNIIKGMWRNIVLNMRTIYSLNRLWHSDDRSSMATMNSKGLMGHPPCVALDQRKYCEHVLFVAADVEKYSGHIQD